MTTLDLRQSTIFSRVRGLLEVTRLVRSGNELPVLLLAIARTVSDSLGFRTVVINVYRREWDDFVVTTVYGSDEAREALLGQVRQHSDWAPLLDERFLNRGAYLVPHGEFDWGDLDAYTPELPEPDDPSMWHPEDALFVPLRDAEGKLLGVLSVDEPSSGRQPSGEEIDVLVAVSEHAALAVQAAQETARTQSNRDALAQLLGVSARLNEWTESNTLLEHVCSAISEALGFQRVAVQLLEEDGHHRTAATAGFGPGENIGRALTADQLERLLRPEFDIAGCYLIPDEIAHSLLPDRGGGYRSQHDGRGPYAWSNHWLFVPLYDRRSRRIGYIWVDDPHDRMRPDAERLQILRLFANQATNALEGAAQLEAVQNSNERYRALIDASPVAIINFDFEGRVRSWNAGATALFGWAAGETVGRPNPTLPEDERGFFDDLNRVRAGETLRDLDRRRLRNDGELIDVSISAGPIRDAHGEVIGVIALMVDVTARKRSERALGASEARKEAILRAALDSVVLIDEAGLVIEMNPAAEETFGWTVADAIGRPFIELAVAPEHRESLAEALDGIGAPVEITALRSDHRTFPAEASITRVDVTGPPLYAVSLRDVTRRREHEERLIAAEAKYRTLVEQIPLATYVNSTGMPIRTTYMSPQIEEMLGYPVSAWLEPDFFPTILHPDDRERVLEEVDRTHRVGEPFRQEYRLLRPDGESVWVLDETMAVRDEQYRPLFLQGFLVDISDRRTTETPTGGSLRA
ncbi:MAG TPA: PAS domain S-box protein [Gaiellaceae bacterium]|nr:PAS domain S-box protein [Gaiellaceae bacterium]